MEYMIYIKCKVNYKVKFTLFYLVEICIKMYFMKGVRLMLTKFKIILNCEKEFYNVNMGSLFHGVIMDMMDIEYAEKLHTDNLKPFSQSISSYETGICWNVCALNDEFAQAFQKVIEPKKEIFLRNKEKILEIQYISLNEISYKDFIETHYFSTPEDYITVYFNTPTAYKLDGKYINYPILLHMYNNLIRKFDTFSGEFSLYDAEMVEDIANNSSIVSYNLKSTNYSLESIKIPSFVGRIGVKIKGPSQLKNLVRLLLKFGEYSGAGIKTAMGMGAVQTILKSEKRGAKNENGET